MTTHEYKFTDLDKKIMDFNPRNIRQLIRVGDRDILVYPATESPKEYRLNYNDNANKHLIFHDVQSNKVCASQRFGWILTACTEDSISFYHHKKKCFVTRKFNFDMDESELLEEMSSETGGDCEEVSPIF